MNKRVLICANPDLNFIDGSSIWAQTIALATAATGSAQVDFLAKSAPEREELFAPLRQAANLTILDGTAREHWAGKSVKRLTLPMLAELAVTLDRKQPYDVIIVRGRDIAKQLLETPAVLAKCWLYLTDIPQSVKQYDAALRQTMQRLATGCQRLLCQAEGFRALWQTLVPGLDSAKIHIYTPVIPDLPATLLPLVQRPAHAIYAGKFKGDWMTLEMAEIWPTICQQVPGSALLMIGDKIHNEPGRPDYAQRMRQVLEHTPGVNWLGPLSREATQQRLRQARIGLSWRADSMDDTLEYSTKILEYGGAGCAAILNRTPLHEDLLGRDYPLFANTEQEFKQQLLRALREPQAAQRAADTLKTLAERHTFSARVNDMRQWLAQAPRLQQVNAKTRVLVAGHDLKFFTQLQKSLEATGNFEFLIDQWKGHNSHDEAQSLKLLEQADVIFCEWCLGNVKWYSHHKKPQQRLVVRFHAQEIRSVYLRDAKWDAIDHIGFVSEPMRRKTLEIFGFFPYNKTSVIPNYLDEKKFTPTKKTGDARYVLGMIGIAPKSKRLDRAIDLLEDLLKQDNRYCLRIKGKNPLDYSWLLERADELAYYETIFERINKNPQLRHKVIFDPPGDDVNTWFTMIGYILSPSDFESFHMAVGEGMLTGTVPIVWDWDGAKDIWGAEWVVDGSAQAKAKVFGEADIPSTVEAVLGKYPSWKTTAQWCAIVIGEGNEGQRFHRMPAG